jgi:hypothetical protein
MLADGRILAKAIARPSQHVHCPAAARTAYPLPFEPAAETNAMSSTDRPRYRRARLGAALSALALLAGCGGPSVLSESQDKVQISHGYPAPLKDIGALAADRCARYGRAPVFESDAAYDDHTAIANFRCAPVR